MGTTTTSGNAATGGTQVLAMSLELGASEWKLAFSPGPARAARFGAPAPNTPEPCGPGSLAPARAQSAASASAGADWWRTNCSS